MREERWSAGVVVPLASVGCEDLDCWSGILEAPLCGRPGAAGSSGRLAEFSPRRLSPP
jgi:hypothetical protein